MGVMKRLYEARAMAAHQESEERSHTRRMARALIDLSTGTSHAERKATAPVSPTGKVQRTMWG